MKKFPPVNRGTDISWSRLEQDCIDSNIKAVNDDYDNISLTEVLLMRSVHFIVVQGLKSKNLPILVNIVILLLFSLIIKMFFFVLFCLFFLLKKCFDLLLCSFSLYNYF
jgi:hypothetical protein